MRIAALSFCSLILLAACERGGDSGATAPLAEEVKKAEVSVSDELPGLSSPATGIAFWEHPALAFNSLMVVANAEGLVSYNIEDGNEVSRINGIDAQGAAVSYVGLGPTAAGILATFDKTDLTFRLYIINTATRSAIPMLDAPQVRGDVRGFCFGRAADVNVPTLFVVQREKISIFNFEKRDDAIAISGEVTVDAPDDLSSCAVDIDGVLLLAAKDGDIYRLTSEDSFDAPIAKARTTDAGDITVIASTMTDEDETESIEGQIVLLDRADGSLHVFDRSEGTPLGIVNAIATDELAAVTSANVMGAIDANLGALYRNGVIAFGAGEEDPVIRLIPVNGLFNALSIPEGTPISPRGELAPEEDSTLLIETGYQPEGD